MTEPSNSAAAQHVEKVEPLEDLEVEHRRLSERRRRLHEAIDVLERAGSLKPDSAALLARYKRTERSVSWDRGVLYRKIRGLRAGAATRGSEGATPAEDLQRSLPGGSVDKMPEHAGTGGVFDTPAREVSL